MILQRDKPINIWGWAAPGEKVLIKIHAQSKQTLASKEGKWIIQMKPEAAGGPFTLEASGQNKIIIKNILFGEIWICSGQSNMEMTVASSKNAIEEIKNGYYPTIRQFKIPAVIAAKPEEDLSGGEWLEGTPANVGSFTAAGYYFAKEIEATLHVPVGIINASWGGTVIETWISEQSLRNLTAFADKLIRISFSEIQRKNHDRNVALRREIESSFGPVPQVPWTEKLPSLEDDSVRWKNVEVPFVLDENGLAKFDGVLWFKKTIYLDKNSISGEATLNLSRIDDKDETYINRHLVGSSNSYDVNRQYKVPPGILKEGANEIMIRVMDGGGNGGFFGKPSELTMRLPNETIPLAGGWLCAIEYLQETQVHPNQYPALLFNSMISPLTSYQIRGVLWYQGESNANRAHEYKSLFPLLINDWRGQFHQEFPFYFVQLASYNWNGGNSRVGSEWAELREAQAKTLSLPKTGMAVAIDIGESNDIHPKNKQTVGERLAAIALHETYNQPKPYLGPEFMKMTVDKQTVVLTFSNAESGFKVNDKYGYIKGFEVAGNDHRFYYAQAQIENHRIIVHSDSVRMPVAVRYGWADDMPETNLYNYEGLPTASFRSDSWPGITERNHFKIE